MRLEDTMGKILHFSEVQLIVSNTNHQAKKCSHGNP